MTSSAFDPASRVRFIQFIPALQRAGWQTLHRPNRPDRQWKSPLRNRIAVGIHYRGARMLMKYNRWLDVMQAGAFDVVFANRDLAGDGLFLEKRLLKRNPRVIYDFDDAIYIGKNEPAIRWMCRNAAWVTPGNETLARFAREESQRVTVIPTVIDTEKYYVRSYGPQVGNDRIRVGWSGSDQSIAYGLFPYLGFLAELQKTFDFELVIIANSEPKLPVPGIRWKFHKWEEADESDLGKHIDIGIMPLEDNKFQRGKCGLKLLQYMAAGLPTIASPVGVNSEITLEGRTGFLAANTEQWVSALKTLVSGPALRADLGTAGRRRCVEHYSVARWLPTLIEIFEKVRAQNP
jgi:glycosyltransferase involved in cell wall biosynthesis